MENINVDELLKAGKEDELLKAIAKRKTELEKEEADKKAKEKAEKEKTIKIEASRKKIVKEFMNYMSLILDTSLDDKDMKDFEKSLIILENRMKKIKESEELRKRNKTSKYNNLDNFYELFNFYTNLF